jgi:hypothetical protein
VAVAPLDAFHQFLDGPGLVAPGLVFGFELEFGHSDNLYHSETVEQGQPAVRFAEGIYKRVLLVYLGKASIREDFKPAKSLSSLPSALGVEKGITLAEKKA